MADELFSKRLPVLFKSNDREDRRGSVYLRMEIQAVSAPLQRKELVVRLTDEKDLFFLYTLRLGEEDFQTLKLQQGLLVDVGAFPQKFIDLLELCLKEEHKDNPKFILHLVSQCSLAGEKSSAVLNIIETNPFKHLTHLSLKFVPGSDADIKKYLADCLKQLTETNMLLQQRLEHTNTDLSQKLQHTQESLAARTAELENLKSEWTSRIADLFSRHKEEITAEKERSMQVQNSLQERYEREKRELEQASTKLVHQMESKIHDLDRNNKDLMDKNYKSESTVRELRSKLSGLEEDHMRMKQDIQTLRKQNAGLDSEYHEQEKLINQLRTRIAVLEQEVKDKEHVLAKSSDLLHAEQDQKNKYKEDLDRKNKDLARLESKVKAMSEELVKGNEIIKKLQGEIKNYHAKVKLRNQIATEQEKLLSEKDQELEKLRQELATIKDSYRQNEDENKKLKDSLESTTNKLEECRQLLKTNENVIQWLNKQINEQQLSHHRLGAFEMPSATSNMRPSSAGMHNFSTSSYGSASHLPSQPMTNPGIAMPRPYPNAHRQPQVQYNPGNPRKTHLPVPVSRVGPPPPIPEEIRPTSNHSNHSSPGSTHSADKENDPPVDPKYFQKREDAIPVRGLMNRSNSPVMTSAPQTTVVTNSSTRISQQMIVPRHTQPPLASAYFPGQSKAS
ncbi:LOW QUALITY PROTEIN: spindle assembly abnormal protein 6 homolog [Gigantopelta aegis]|uniref:LOW QUALITY PROTEIN: spindle assembly abnormal protein 6 homolog n=1 Tax=Gigantopelta aegis TaxID=1735272 RepID=UPI001B88C9EE|nr:LOW QUALITY PROTEIN: spindle assembly abnormal protein 6 homolog [Gigantopelta aegis]